MQMKSQLRKELILRRKNLIDKSARDSAIFKELVEKIKGFDLVLTYYSTPIEVDTHRLIEFCFLNKIKVALPVIVDEEMKFYCLTDDWEFDFNCQLSTVNRQLCVVPGLAYDKNNRRIGYGGGYYDRFLRDFSGYKIGLCYEEFMMDIPYEEHDEKVDLVIWK